MGSFKDWTQEDVERHNQKVRNGKNINRGAGSATKLESGSFHAAEKQDAVEAINERVAITFIVYRHKLIDPDNNYSKHFTDGIVESGLLRNDTASEIEEIRYRQVKIPEWEQERTVIELTPADC